MRMMPFCLGLLFLFFLGACSPQRVTAPASVLPGPATTPSVQPVSDSASRPASIPTATPHPFPHPSGPSPEFGGPALSETHLSSSVQHDPVIRGGGSSGSDRGSGNSSGTGSLKPQPSPTPLFYINDVMLAESGQSVMGADAPAALGPVYISDAPINLLITGNFATTLPFSEAAMRFTFEPGLLHQSFSGDAPAVRVLLNESLLLEPVSVNINTLRVSLPQYLLPDLYLQGLHTLSIHAGTQRITTQIQVGPPAGSATLIPVLEQVTFLPVQDNVPASLRLEGKHFILQPAWQQLVFQGQTLAVSQVEINANGQAVAWVSLDFEPEPGNHTVRYQTPFGVVNQEVVIP